MKVKGSRIFISSLGCSKNLVDAEVMLGMLTGEQAIITDDASNAEIIIVNTCSFVEDAKEESIETILEMVEHKRGFCKKLIVSGCMTQRYWEQLEKELPEVDLFVGTGEYQRIVELIEEYNQTKVAVGKPTFIHSADDPRVNSGESYQAWLKIAEGCDRCCSFCIIPTLRGEHRRRDVDSLVKEARALVKNGVKELNIISQDISQYGPELITLLARLEQIEGLEWIRLLYFYPDDLTDEFIDYMSQSKKLCRYLDMPVQHFSDGVLKRMNRKITGDQIMAKIEHLRRKVPDIALRTSIIVGFPGESSADFETLLKGIKKARFDHLGVFSYSDEEDTPSYKMSEKIDQNVIKQRQQAVYETQEEISSEINQKYLGAKLEVIVEGVHSETELLIVGRHRGQAPEIDGQILINDTEGRELKKGDLVIVEVSEVIGFDLVAKLY